MDGQGEVDVIPRSPFASNGSSSHDRDSVGSGDHSLHRRTSSSARRKSAWKRVSQLYSLRQSNGAAADDDLDEGGLWDNNDQDFHRQVALESKEDLSSQVHVFTSASANASMEEVSSPGEQRRSFLDTTRSPSVIINSTNPTATSSTRSLPASSKPSQPLVIATPMSELSLASSDYAPHQRTMETLVLVEQQRPASSGGTSLYTSRSYSTVCSETSSALTYPSPGSSKVELHARHRLSNPQQQKRLSNSKDASPTGATFSALTRQHSALDTTQTPPHTNPLPPAQHAIQLSGWTQEQIQSPPPSGEQRPGSFQSLAHAPLAAATGSPSQWTADYVAPPLTLQASTVREQRRLTAAESVRDQALHNLHQRRPSAQQLGEWQESTDTMVNGSSNIAYESASLPALPFAKPPSTQASPTKPHNPSNDSAGLLSGFKKLLRAKKVADKAATAPPAPSAQMNVRTQVENGADIDAPAPYDGQRRPSLPHVGTAPAIPRARRLSMQVAQEKKPLHWSTIDSQAVSAALSKPQTNDNHGLPPAQRRRRPSADTFVQRILGQPGASPSRNSVIEHTSFDEAKRRSGVWSTMQNPSLNESLYRSSSLVKTSAPVTSSASYTTLDDAQEELQGESDGNQRCDSDVRSLSSIRSAPHILPHRPPRHDEGETQSRPVLDPYAKQHKRRPSVESMFNAAHDRRWSAVGHSHVGSLDASDATQNAGSMTSPSSSLLSLSESGGVGVPAALSRVDSIANSVVSNDGASSIVSNSGNGHTSSEMAHGRHQRARSSVEAGSNSLASLIMGSLPLARKSSVSCAAISRPLEVDGARSEDALLASIGSLDSKTTTSNRNSGSSDECMTTVQDATARRPSRSTNDLPLNGAAPSMHRSISNQSLSSMSLGAAPKRPTFGLELQADAAAAFDSIPLPATPDKRRSRSLSTSSDQITMAPSMHPHDRSGSTSSLAKRGSQLLSTAEDAAVHISDTPTTVPADLPSDVEDVEDLLDMEGDMTLTDGFEHAHPSSDIAFSVAPSADEMELLQEREGVAASSKCFDEQRWDAGEEQQFGRSNAVPSSNEQYASLSSYRFPPVVAASKEATISSPPSLAAPPLSVTEMAHKTAAPQPSQLARRVSSFSQNAALPPPPPPAKLVAAHLRRPSSSDSYV